MVKGMKRAISFVMAVCLLVGSGFLPDASPKVTITPEVLVQEGDKEESVKSAGKEEAKSLLNTVGTSFSKVSELWNSMPIIAKAAPDPTPAVSFRDEIVFSFGGTLRGNGETANMPSNHIDVFIEYYDETGRLQPWIKKVTFNAGSSQNMEVKPINPDPADPNSTYGPFFRADITASAPGYIMIAALAELQNGESRQVTVTFRWGGELEEEEASGATWKDLGTSSNEYEEDIKVIDHILVLDPLKTEGYQLRFKGIEPKDYYSQNIIFSTVTAPPDVVEVNEEGYLKIVGSGYTEVRYTNTANVAEGEKTRYLLRVIVLPYAMENEQNENKWIPNGSYLYRDAAEFVLETNAKDANRLIWKIETAYGKIRDIKAQDDELLSYTLENQTIKFSNAKAGTYRVRAYAIDENDFQSADAGKQCLDFYLVVRPNLNPGKYYMSKGDTYNLNQNSNIPDGMFMQLFKINRIPMPEMATRLDTSSIITAVTTGSQRYEFEYSPTSGCAIYPDDKLNEVFPNGKTYMYDIEVIDYLTMPSLIELAVGATYPITASTSYPTVPIQYECREGDEQYFDVDANGIITAKKETPTNYMAQVIGYQMVNGVKKMATCNIIIKSSATKITLEASRNPIDIGETLDITAILTPLGSSVDLSWQTSDPSVLGIVSVNQTTTTVRLTGLKAGTAIVTAVNRDNAVVGYATITVKQPVTSINIVATLSLRIGQQYQFVPTTQPANATNQKLLWKSSNNNIVSVDANGKITANRAGSAVITVQSEDNPALIAQCTVTVLQTVSGVELDETLVEMYVGETKRLTYMVYPSGASNPDVEWTSFNTSIVTVSNDGMLSARRPGTAQVMIMSYEDSSCYEICTVVVKQRATNVRMNATEVTMNVGEYYDMDITVTPATATDANLTWESLNTRVVTVSSTGRITARGVGTAIILVRTEGGATSYCTVTVLEAVRSMELDPSEVTIDVGETFTIEPVFRPASASNTQVRWESSDTSVATISAAGTVTGVERGTAVITCTSMDGGYKAFCLVTVEDPLLEIRIDPETYRLGFGKTYTLHAVLVKNGEVIGNAEVNWFSSDDSICTVDRGGEITGEDYGYATITAEAVDGSGRSGKCEVRVVREVTSIKLNHSSLTIIQGETAALVATVQPSNATYTTVLYSSDDESIAMVDDDGVITGLKPGTVMVYARARDNSGKYAMCYVTVIAPVASTGISTSDTEVVLMPGETKAINISMRPNNSTDRVTWSSANEAIATVSGSGVITAISTGTTSVTVMTSSGRTARVTVIVLGLSRTSLEIPVYTQYSRLVVDGATTAVRWDVEDTSICDVVNGVITARKVGTTYVTATVNGRTLRCRVKVVK